MATPAILGVESSALTAALDLFLVCVGLVYLALLYWTYRDARQRLADPALVFSATLLAVLPFAGPLVYLILRPAETLQDSYERELDVESMRLQLAALENRLCPHCDHPVELDYLRCPSCERQLREPCGRCGRPLEPGWAVCPYCEARVGGGGRRRSRPQSAAERDTSAVAPPTTGGRGATTSTPTE